jgi:hypothetical protein
MRNEMEVSSLNNERTKRIVWPASIIAACLITVLGGCSSATPPPETAAQKQVLATFDINKCQQMGPDIYKCPAVDKPVCSPNYNGPLECVRIGKDGGVYVASPQTE